MDERTALGWLVVGLLNEHFSHPEDEWDREDSLGAACHASKCGPCSALLWFSETPERRAVLERCVLSTGYVRGGWAYWDSESDGLRWDWFHEYWTRHRACWVSNGVAGCYSDENDEDDGE